MNQRTILDLLRKHKPVLAKRFDLFESALFGSSARDEADDQSDIDVLVSFEGPGHRDVTSVSSFTWKTYWASPLIS